MLSFQSSTALRDGDEQQGHGNTSRLPPRIGSRDEFPGTLRRFSTRLLLGYGSRTGGGGGNLTGGGASSFYSNDQSRYQRGAALWFYDRLLERAFLASYLCDWNARILLGLVLAVVDFCSFAVVTSYPIGILLCFIAIGLLWLSTAAALAMCKRRLKRHPEPRVVAATHDRRDVRPAAATAAMPVGRNGSAATLQRSPVVIPTAQRHHRPPTTTVVVTAESTRPEDVAFYAELICIWWLYGAIVFYTATLAFSKSTCEARDTFEARYNDCYRVYSLDANTMMLVVVATAFAPIRFVFFFLFVLTVVAAFVIANLLGPSESYVPERFVSSLAIFVAQQLVCTVWSYRREQDARDSFVAQTNLEQQTREWQEIRLLAEAAATRAVSQEVVKQLLLRGERSIECPTALVCCFSIKNFARWSRSRSPADVVRMLSDLVRVYETELLPISTGTMVHSSGAVNAPRGHEKQLFTKVHTFGEEVMYVVQPALNHDWRRDTTAAKSDDMDGSLRNTAVILCQCVSLAISNIERMIALYIEDGGRHVANTSSDGNPSSRRRSLVVDEDVELLVPAAEEPSVLLTGRRTAQHRSHTQRDTCLAPAAYITLGAATLSFLPSICATVASGAAVVACTEGLRNFMHNCAMAAMTAPSSSVDDAPLASSSVEPTSSSSLRLALAPDVMVLLGSMHSSASGSSVDHQRSTLPTASLSTDATGCVMDDVCSQNGGGAPLTGLPCPTKDSGVNVDEAQPQLRRVVSFEQTNSALLHRFTDPRVELEFRKHSHTNFEHRIVKLNAASMVGLALAMLFVCGVYDQWSWEVRSPLPYIVCSGLVGPLMLLALWCQPPCMVGCLEGLNWAFLYLCIGASVMTPQHASIFGGSILPWQYVGATVSMQRPLWYPPLAMWALDGTFSFVIVLLAVLPTRDLVVSRRALNALIGLACLVFSFFLRTMLDRTERERYATRRQLEETHIQLEKEAQHLLRALKEIAPNRVAERILKRSRHGKYQCRNSGANVTSIKSATEDQAFAVIHAYVAPSAAMGAQLPQLGLVELFAVTDVVTKCVSECLGVVVKSCGDVLLVGLDEDSSTSARCRSEVVRQVVRMVLRVRKAVSGIVIGGRDALLSSSLSTIATSRGASTSTCRPLLASASRGSPRPPPGVNRGPSSYELCSKDMPAAQAVECRAWVGMSLMMGAMIGAHAPSFEWYGVDVSTALHVVQRAPLAPDSPVPANAVVLSERAAYYFAQRHAEDGDDGDTEVSLGGRSMWSMDGVGRRTTYALQFK